MYICICVCVYIYIYTHPSCKRACVAFVICAVGFRPRVADFPQCARPYGRSP